MVRFRIQIHILVFVFLLVASSIFAQESKSDRLLSLDEVMQLAIENSLEIQIAKYDAQISRANEGVSESIYDTFMSAEAKYSNDQSQQTSTIFGTKTIDNDYNVGFAKKLPMGTTISVDMANNRHSTNSAFTTSLLTHESSVALTIQQELGKNFFGLTDRSDIKLTRLEIENSQYLSLEKIEDQLAQAQKAYWDLALASKKEDIAQDMYGQAERLFLLHDEKLKNGVIEEGEFLNSEANFKSRANELQLVQNEKALKNNILKLILNIEDKDSRIVPTQIYEIPNDQYEMERSLKLAFEHRRDYKRSFNGVKAKKIQLTIDKNKIWPEINVTASLARNGLGDHFPNAVENISREDNPELFVGLEFSMPLENTKARSTLQQSELNNAKELLNLKLIERKIVLGISDSVRNVNIYLEQAKNSQTIAELQHKKYEEEEKRFNRGRSDTDTLIRYQEDFSRAELNAAQSIFDYQNALITLKQTEGALLQEYWKEEF
jgi:outer membrane protein TolC